MLDRSSKRPRDVNQLAKLMVDIATSESQCESEDIQSKNPAAVALGRLGGLAGGVNRAQLLTPERRSEIARIAAQKRWQKKSAE